MFFDKSPVFRLEGGSSPGDVRPLVWFATEMHRSGAAGHWVRAHSRHGCRGRCGARERATSILFGPEITFRAQSHGTFKFLFNGIYYGPPRRPSSTDRE